MENSRRITVVDDSPGLFNDPGYLLRMPNPPLYDSGYWINDVWNASDINGTTHTATDLYSGEVFEELDPNLTDIDYISGKNHLFYSTTPTGRFTNTSWDSTTGYDSSVADRDQAGSSLQVRFEQSGYKTVLFGAYSNTYNLYHKDTKARWTKGCGITMSSRSILKDQGDFNFKFVNLFLLFKKFNDVKRYYAPIIKDSQFMGDYTFKGKKPTEDHHVTHEANNHFSAFIDTEYARRIETDDITCVGMIMNFYSSGNAAVDFYDFKLHLSHHGVDDNHSYVVIPAPHNLQDREEMHSVPIV